MLSPKFLLASSVFAALPALHALAVVTPYGNAPGAVVTNTGLLWDNQFAQMFDAAATAAGKQTASRIFVFDFCFSGAFVDDLGNGNTFIATAAAWHETSSSAPALETAIGAFGQTFMTSAGNNGNTLNNAYSDAATAVIGIQEPQKSEGNNTLANSTLSYANGDRAIIFSAGDATQQLSFWTDVSTAYNGLTNALGGAWPANPNPNPQNGKIAVLWDQGQTAPAGPDPSGAAYVTGTSTKANLQAAVTAAYNDPNFTNSSKLVVYVNDHGINTDVDKVKVTGAAGNFHYQYESHVSQYRYVTTAEDPHAQANANNGVWEIRLLAYDINPADYSNWVDPKPSWHHKFDGNQIIFYGDPSDPTTWLDSALDYDYGYDNLYGPKKSAWVTDLNYTDSGGAYVISDYGFDDGSAWGAGKVVYDQPNTNTPDPSQWAGWDNGGDGWIEVPVPEPASLALLGLGAGIFLRRRR